MKKNMVNLTITEMRKKVMRLHPGDIVEIQVRDDEPPIVAKVDKIYTNIVMFEKPNGTKFSTNYFDAMNANIIKSSDFVIRDDNMELDDMANAFMNM